MSDSMPQAAAPRLGRDRRVHQRVSVLAPATLFMNDAARPARCVNLSMGGAGLLCEETLKSGTLFKLALDLGGGRRLQALSQVVRANGSDIGVRFIQLDPKSMVAILAQLR